MSYRTSTVPYKAPDIWVNLTTPDVIICTSWNDGNIPDEDYNDFGTA
jgi:hypothetical protein